MRDVMAATKRGGKETLHAIGGLPHRHPLPVAGALLGIVMAYLIVGQVETQREVNYLRPEITKIVHSTSICNAKNLSKPEASRLCARQLEIAFLACRKSIQCRTTLLAVVLAPVPPGLTHLKGVMPQPSHGGQQPAPGLPGAQANPPNEAAPAPPAEGGHGEPEKGSHGPPLEICLRLPTLPPCVKAGLSG